MFGRLSSVVRTSTIRYVSPIGRIQQIHTTPRLASLFGEITQKTGGDDKKLEAAASDEPVTVENDETLQKYHFEEASKKQIKIDKYITPLKKTLFELNVSQNGFFKNNHVIKHDGKSYRLSLTEKEIDMLEPSIYATSYRIKSSMKKATQVNRFVRGFNVKTAINQLHFNPKKMATELEQVLKRGLEQARILGLDEDTMYIDSLWTGSDGDWRKRPDFKGRGRGGLIEHPYIHVKSILKSNQTKLRKAWEKEQKIENEKPVMFLNNEPLNFKVRPVYKW